MSAVRDKGFYAVHLSDTEGWVVAEWDGSLLAFCGSEEMGLDEELQEIGERIMLPSP